MIKKIVLGLSIGFAIFISLFALDVFNQSSWFVALLIHLIPAYITIILTIISWKSEFLGGILWLVMGLFYLWMSWQGWIIYIPAIIIGGLNVWLGKNRKLV
jgi:hypothetical protein